MAFIGRNPTTFVLPSVLHTGALTTFVSPSVLHTLFPEGCVLYSILPHGFKSNRLVWAVWCKLPPTVLAFKCMNWSEQVHTSGWRVENRNAVMSHSLYLRVKVNLSFLSTEFWPFCLLFLSMGPTVEEARNEGPGSGGTYSYDHTRWPGERGRGGQRRREQRPQWS